MSAQELYNIINTYIHQEKERVEKKREKIASENDYFLGRWAVLTTLEYILDKLDPEVFPDLGEDEK